jgi:amino acid permease
MINYQTYLSFFGTAVYAYEGIGIVVPIMDETKDKKGFA